MKPLALILSVSIGVVLWGCTREEPPVGAEPVVSSPSPSDAAASDSAQEAASETPKITRNSFRMTMLQQANDDPDLKDDPVQRDFVLCMSLSIEDEIFTGPMALTKEEFEVRAKSAMDSLGAGLKRGDDAAMRQGVSCMLAAQSGTVMSQIDANDSGPGRSASLPPLMDMDDLRLDFDALEGRDVLVRGVGVYMMDVFQLKDNALDMSPIFVDTSGLPREERKKILNKCGDLMAGCGITVHGTVGPVMYQRGLIAKNVYW